MKVLIACEESQRVCIAFRERGHEAYSCDILECSGGHPEWHIQQDVLPLLNGDCIFETCDKKLHSVTGRWDMIIAFPPCTDLTVAGAKYFKQKRADGRQDRAIEFFMKFALADCDRISIENPVGIMSTKWRKPDQYIQPYQFGHGVSKKTCLWLKGLPKLQPTEIVEYEKIHSKGRTGGYSGNSWYCRDENGKILAWNDPRTAIIRSKTFPGIAKAMAEQWGKQEDKS